MLPIVALVGRPNVGKSTLFNALTRRRDALVADLPGVTRDRHYGLCEGADRHFMLVDTGGLGDDEQGVNAATAQQVRLAIDEATAVVLIVDARDGLLPRDESIVAELRRSGKPVVVAVNKTDGLDPTVAVAEFASLGFATMLPLSAAHRRGTDELLEALTAHLPDVPWQPPIHDENIRVAIVGRPNAGKSTLINRLLGEQRLVVSEVAGTTRDPIEVTLERDGRHYTLIDTAGIRRRSRIEQPIEKFSVIKAMQAIAAAEVVVLLIDAHENLAEQDLTLIGHALEQGRALVVALNKWDGMDDYARQQCRTAIDRRLVFVPWAPRVTLSAKHGSGLRELMGAVVRGHAAAGRELRSAELNRALEDAYAANPPPLVNGHAPKLRFAHPGGRFPPTIVLHGTRTRHIRENYRRYLENFMRKRFGLDGTPLRIEFRESENPFAGRHNTLTTRQVAKRQRLIRHRRGH